MKVLLTTAALMLTAVLAFAQKASPTLEEVAAKRWSEMHADRIAATADGQGITLSDIRRQIEPVVGQIRASVRSDSEFEKALGTAAEDTLRSMTERQLVIADFRAGTGKLPAMYIDADIEETVISPATEIALSPPCGARGRRPWRTANSSKIVSSSITWWAKSAGRPRK